MNALRLHRRILQFLSLGMAAIVMVACGLQRPQAEPLMMVVPTVPPTALPTYTASPAPITVFVSGEVQAPGVYTLPPASRIVDAITAAEGLTDEADASAVNQATPLVDGMQIHIPRPAEVATPLPVSLPNEESTGSTTRIHLNRASATELETLPGIGETRAADIIHYRETHGDFQSIEELLNVPGIGDATLDNLRDFVTIE